MNKQGELEVLLGRLRDGDVNKADLSPEAFKWLIVIQQAKESGDLSALVTQLRTDTPIPTEVGALLADLLYGQRLPARAITDHQWELLAAAGDYYDYELNPSHLDRDKDFRLNRLAEKNGVSPEQLEQFVKGQGNTAVSLRKLLRRNL